MTGASAAGPFSRLALVCARRRRAVIAAWAVAVVALGAMAPRLADELIPGGFEVAGSTSERARSTIERAFADQFPSQATLVVTSRRLRAGDPAFDAVVARAAAAVRRDPLVGGARTPADDPRLVAPGRHLALVDVGLRAGLDEALRDIDRVVDAARAAGSGEVSVGVTGSPPIFAEFNDVNEEDLRFSELIQLPLVILILLLVLGSVVAAALPIVTAACALLVTLGGLVFVARGVDLSIYVQNVVPLVGIGVAVDYSLLVVGRFREELRAGRDPVDAACATGGTAGRAVFFSGLTVAVALAGMLAVGVPIFTGFAVGTIAVVAMAMLVALTLMPALLAALGRRVFRWDAGGAIRRALRGGRPPADADRWGRWAETVMRRPCRFLLLGSALMLALAIPALDMRLGTSGTSVLPTDTQAARATAAVADAFGPGFALPIKVVVDARGRPVRGDPAIAQMARRIARDPEMALMDPRVAYSRDGTVALITAYARHDDDSREAQDLVGRIASRDAPAAEALRGDDVSIGGAASQNRDFRRTVSRNLPRVIGIVMLLTFLVLVVLFRSLLLPLKAVVMTLLSAVAAYGVLVMVFQWGWGDALLGFESRGHITAWVPPFLFSILFGLSMDYEVFMLSRIREARERGLDDRAAVADGLARSGRIITAAAAIMIVVFLSFITNRLIPIKESALGLAVAVLLDATVARIVLVPALMRLAGRWNWWLPDVLERYLPHVGERELRGRG